MTDLDKICEFLEHSGIACSIIDGKTEFVYVNSVFGSLCGHNPEEMTGESAPEILHGEDTDQYVFEMVQSKLDNGTPFGFTIQNYRKNREKYNAGVFMIPFVSGPKSKPYSVAICREVATPNDSVMSDAPPEFRKVIGSVLSLVQAD